MLKKRNDWRNYPPTPQKPVFLVVSHFSDRKLFFSGKKMGLPLINFVKKLGVPPNPKIFRRRGSGARSAPGPRSRKILGLGGTPNFFKQIFRGRPIFLPGKKSFRRCLTPSTPHPPIKTAKKSKKPVFFFGGEGGNFFVGKIIFDTHFLE